MKEKRPKERPRIYPKSTARHLRPTTLPGKGTDASTCDNIRSAIDDCERASMWFLAASPIINLLRWLDSLMISLGAFFFSLLVGLVKVPVRVVSAIISDKPPWLPDTPQTVRESSSVLLIHAFVVVSMNVWVAAHNECNVACEDMSSEKVLTLVASFLPSSTSNAAPLNP